MTQKLIDNKNIAKYAFDFFFWPHIFDALPEIIGDVEFRKISKIQKSIFNVNFLPNNVNSVLIKEIIQSRLGKKTDMVLSNIMNSLARIQKDRDGTWISTNVQSICLKVLNSYGDSTKKAILDHVHHNSNNPLEIIKSTNLTQASAYRNIRELISDGLIIPIGVINKKEGRKASIYSSMIERILIDIEGEDVFISFIVKKQFLSDSILFSFLEK